MTTRKTTHEVFRRADVDVFSMEQPALFSCYVFNVAWRRTAIVPVFYMKYKNKEFV